MKRRHFAALGLIISFICIAIFFFFLAIHQNPPVEIYSATIDAEMASPGDFVTMTVDFCKYTDVDSKLTTYWRRETDGLIWELKSRETNLGVARCGKTVIPLVVPSDIPNGNWQRVNVATYQVNFMAARTVEWSSNYIRVLKTDG